MVERLGPYTLERRIGAGGMADVFLAQGPKGICVIKRPHAHLCSDPDFVRMFLDEASLLAQLHHPGIAEIFDLGQIGATYYLAMEYVPGFDLMTISLEHEGQGELIAPELCARIIADAAGALHCAHEARGRDGQPLNLVHRDVSPHNILLSTTGAVKLIDFGVAKASGSLHRTQAGLVKGKYPYMAPEQVAGLAIDRRVDVYALGLVLYELLTNTRAIQGNTDVEQIQNARASCIRPIEQLRPNVTEPIRLILGSCLHPDPNGRYATAQHLREDLEKYLVYERRQVGQEDLLRLFRVVAAEASHAGTALEPALAAPSFAEKPGDATWQPSHSTELEQPLPDPAMLPLALGRTEPSVPKPMLQLGPEHSASRTPQPVDVAASAPAPLVIDQPGVSPVVPAAGPPVGGPPAHVVEAPLDVLPRSRLPLVVGGIVALLAAAGGAFAWMASPSDVDPVKVAAGASDAGSRSGGRSSAEPGSLDGLGTNGEPFRASEVEPRLRGAAPRSAIAVAETPPVVPTLDAGLAPEVAEAPVAAEPGADTPKDVRAAVVPLDCDPPVDIFVDRKAWGRSPKELELAVGKHVLVLENKELALRKTIPLNLAPGERLPLSLKFRKGTLQVNAVPFAELRLNGVVVAPGVSFKEFELWDGPYTLEAVLADPEPGRAPKRKRVQVDVKPGATQTVTINMME